MKLILVITVLLTISTHVVFAQDEDSSLIQEETRDSLKVRHGIEYSHFFSTSGFGTAYEVHFTAQSSCKAKIGFGLFMDKETKKISGITLTYQRFFFSKRGKQALIQPFFVYNFIYRRTNMLSLYDMNDVNRSAEMVTYTSLEHHTGVGFNLHILRNMVLVSSYGYGIYLGSIKRPSVPDPVTREISGTNGSGWLLKTGIGFTL